MRDEKEVGEKRGGRRDEGMIERKSPSIKGFLLRASSP